MPAVRAQEKGGAAAGLTIAVQAASPRVGDSGLYAEHPGMVVFGVFIHILLARSHRAFGGLGVPGPVVVSCTLGAEARLMTQFPCPTWLRW